MQAKLALLLVVVASVALVAGCGGSSHRLSKADYEAKMQALGDKFGQVAKEVRAGDLNALQRIASENLEATRKIGDAARRIKAKGYDIGSAG